MKKNKGHIASQNKRLLIILLLIGVILMFPLIGSQINPEIKWTLNDFLIAGFILITGGLIVEFILRKIKKKSYKALLIVCIFAIIFLLFVEIAVGLFGTQWAGN